MWITLREIDFTKICIFTDLNSYRIVKVYTTLIFIGIGSYLKHHVLGSVKLPYVLNIIFTIQTGSFIDTCIFSFAIATKIKFDNLENLKTQEDLMNAERTALQAQLNPHFIFNSLNAVQYLVIKEDKKGALRYIKEFSGLLRSILQNSSQKSISLDNEIENIRKYISIESIRIDDRFRYSVEIDPSIETEMISVPNLLLQPFVENAIWHGLMHSNKEDLILKISIQSPNSNVITIKIDDNGVGRSFKAKKTENRSTGIDLTTERISLFNKNHDHKIKLDFYDKANNEGTCVILTITFL